MRTDARRAEIWTWIGAFALLGAAVSAEMAWLHARAVEALGVVCGTAPSEHCLWCPAALALLSTGLLALRAGAAGARRSAAAAAPR